MGKCEGKRPLGRPNRRYEDIKSYINILGCFAVDSSLSGCGHMAGFCEHGNESYDFIKLWGLLS